ncbi:unnamed protein product [Darwinula stevensoni]|uniref:CRAL-TRIO domain-containing protein n=1 Tax=Darwinula stevensoni TaxID=69355 RepID=A0A7R8X153_9CRUS|nr:unnamed protein product [Darwinula stevensoni]CAG0881895.1 unnamed protein product [Darwinula stevensoni]
MNVLQNSRVVGRVHEYSSSPALKSTKVILLLPPPVPEPREEGVDGQRSASPFRRRKMQYLLQDAEQGFALVIDRRTGRWSDVRSTLARIAGYFPGHIHVVYVLRPHGFFQKAILEMSQKFFPDDFDYPVILCDSTEDLLDRIDLSQLPAFLDGILLYDQDEWIENRLEVEGFAAQTKEISDHLDGFSTQLSQLHLPQSVLDAENFLTAQRKVHEMLEGDLEAACQQGESLLQALRKPYSASPSLAPAFPGRVLNVATVQRIILQLEETHVRFQGFWVEHLQRLEDSLLHLHFQQDYYQIRASSSEELEKSLGELERNHDVGNSLSEAMELRVQHRECHDKIQVSCLWALE